ncbi:hypothetical protein RvY_14364 [Ramazzottius varieornatus]|uniref:BTB domain-containing protein n=1 Tax=Ramazzottius varieornatus TaxID=947166 RepID=A0A1D1VR09_RAMVA|nr:hypothetical protein RvY_14364 [Ramazzottius varieornatus]
MGHKIVFASFSAILCDLYSAPDNSPEVYNIMTDLGRIRVQARAVKRVFKWMYTGRIKLGKYGCDIKKLAEQLNVKFLLKFIARAPLEHAGDLPPVRQNPTEALKKEKERKLRGLGPAALVKKTSEMSSNVEMTNEEVATLAKQAAVKLGGKSSADALVEQIEKEEMDEKERKKIVLIRIPPPPPAFE